MTQRSQFGFSDSASCSIRRKKETGSTLKLEGYMKVVCKDANGKIKWLEEGPNLVVNEGIDYILGTAILDSATLYVGLMEGSPSIVAGDTMSSHAGWTEAAGYDEATRPSWGQDAVSGQSVSNSTAVSFTMDGTDTTIGGAFIATNATKDGTSGILIAGKSFASNRTVADTDVLEVTYTISGSAS